MRIDSAKHASIRIAGMSALLFSFGAFAADRAPIYNESADAKALIGAAVAKADANNKRVLIQWRGNWCGWCYKLHDLFESDDAIKKTLQYEYELVLIDSNSNEALAQSMDTRFDGVPYLTVLDGHGAKLTDQDTGSLEIGDRHDPAKVLAFLEEWKAQPLDAFKLFDDATARATQDGKAVFVEFSTVWCGWCRRLEEYLQQDEIAGILAPHFEMLNIDEERMENGEQLRNRLSHGEGGGVPWFAFVDGAGNVIATSNGPGGNVGFPAEPEGTQHFLEMIQRAAPEIDAAGREALAAPLREFFEKQNSE